MLCRDEGSSTKSDPGSVPHQVGDVDIAISAVDGLATQEVAALLHGDPCQFTFHIGSVSPGGPGPGLLHS